MKKLVFLALFSLIGVTAMAQSFPISLGIHAGWNDTKIKSKEFKVESHGGYMIGAFARINLGSFYLEPALNFSHKESKVDVGSIGNFKYSSIDIPIMLGYKIVDLSLFKFRGFVGPVASFATKKLNDIVDTDKTMWNGKLGLGVDLWKVTFDVDYEFGLKKFGDGVKAPKSWNLTLGFKIF